MTKTSRIDFINIILIILSFFVAVIMPFKLFLFSYAVLGPIHYMTEIGWLKEKKFFIDYKLGVWFLIGLCLIITCVAFTFEIERQGLFPAFTASALYAEIKTVAAHVNPILVFIAFIAAASFALIKNKKIGWSIIFIAAILSLYVYEIPSYYLIFGMFLPTILHVSLFTILFMFYGALKSKSIFGYVSTGLFTLLCFAIFFIDFSVLTYSLPKTLIDQFMVSDFGKITATFASFLGLIPAEGISITSKLGLQMQIFLAFVYTYHYLNWFSKTKIINWHKVSKKWLVLAVVIWIAAVALYLINFRYGLMALFFLSMLHVFLEFPLNHLSLKGIFTELMDRVKTVN